MDVGHADTFDRTNDGDDAYTLAKKKGWQNVTRFLQSRSKHETEFDYACLKVQYQVLFDSDIYQRHKKIRIALVYGKK